MPVSKKLLFLCWSAKGGAWVPCDSQSSTAEPECSCQGIKSRENAWLKSTLPEGRSLCIVVSDRKSNSFSSSFLDCICTLYCKGRQTQRQQISTLTEPLPLEKYPEKRSPAAIVWSLGLFPANLFPANQGIGLCLCLCCWKSWFPNPSQDRIFGRSGLKMGTGSFTFNCLCSVQKQLLILNSKLFYSF